MNVSSTAMMMVVAVCVVGVAILSGGSVGTDGRMSRFARAESGDMEIAALVETVERKQSGKTAVTLSLCAGMKVAGKGMVYELTDEKTLLYLKDTSCVGDMLPGDTLMARVRVKKVENFAEGFDYVGYMAKKNIYFICFQEGNCSILHCEKPEFRFRILRARRVWIAAMRRRLSPLKTVNEALVLAFLTGEKELVDDDTLKDFRRSGMMHTLALSGLHVGIIYSLLSFVFSVIRNYPTSKKLRSAIVILCLWPYALLTGLGTSICRAVIMASVYELAVILERERAPLNALALSAIIIT
ncbi:MAG: ComEC/Rec2 family competence protein, partial [Alistipes sp.]|nr:ComEC/Rec2 family competence protein [Candidatus Minthomonas equi]